MRFVSPSRNCCTYQNQGLSYGEKENKRERERGTHRPCKFVTHVIHLRSPSTRTRQSVARVLLLTRGTCQLQPRRHKVLHERWRSIAQFLNERMQVTKLVALVLQSSFQRHLLFLQDGNGVLRLLEERFERLFLCAQTKMYQVRLTGVTTVLRMHFHYASRADKNFN